MGNFPGSGIIDATNTGGSEMDVFGIFRLLGGLALFLFGMHYMGKSLEMQAGGRLQKVLGKLTDSPGRGFLLGLAATAVIQSSSATTVMMVGFVNSGVLTLRQAISVILGSNVGTTVTSWILSLTGLEGESFWIQLCKPSNFSPLLAFVGVVLYLFCKSEKKKGAGSILLGFAILMTGMDAMAGAVAPLANEPWFTSLFVRFENPLLGLLAGALLTAVIQSSSASVGILQALSVTGAVSFGSAIPIILGQNIGTCVTALISSVGATKNAKRAAIVHLYFNVIGAFVFLSLFYTLHGLLRFPFLDDAVTVTGIAVVHTVFNVTSTALLLPFAKGLEKLAVFTIPDAAAPEQVQLLDPRLLATPAAAVDRCFAVTGDMADLSCRSVQLSIGLLRKWSQKQADAVYHLEDETDRYEDAAGTYLVKLSSSSLSQQDSHLVNTLLHVISDFERMADHARNLVATAREISDKKIVFSPQAQDELRTLEKALKDLLRLTTVCFHTRDLEAAHQVEPLEQVIDELVRKIKARHIVRLKQGSCSIEYGFVLEDLLTSYERMADHCSNVAVALIEGAEGSFGTHEYLTFVKSGGNPQFDRFFQSFQNRYRFSDETKNKQT